MPSAAPFQFASIELPDAEALDQFCEKNGFPTRWGTEMLTAGCGAIVAKSTDDQIIAMAWSTIAAFYVDEIRLTVKPPAECPYLFGDFVAPAHRGKGLQSALVRERLTQHAGKPAFALIHPTNLASVRSYESHGFRLAATLHVRYWGFLTGTRRITPVNGFTGNLRGKELAIATP